jgi:AraC-like DNA-binding protein
MSESRARERVTMSSCLILPLLAHLERRGLASAPALAAAGLRRDELNAPGARLGHEQAMSLWHHAVSATGDPQVGIRVAQQVDPGVMDLIEYLARCSGTLGESLDRTSTYFGLLHDQVTFRVEREGARVTLRNDVPPGLVTAPAYVENALASTIVMARRMTRKEIPVEAVYFRHARPRELGPYHEVFGDQVIFRAPVDALVLPLDCLAAPLTQADEALAAILERHVRMLLSTPRPVTLRARIAQRIRADLDGGAPQAESIAQRMQMSARTLRRLLRAEGCQFRDVLTEVQRELAFRLLCDPDVPIGEVAYRTGFADPNAFHRAFKRWTGRTPGAFRAGSRHDRAGPA